MRHRLKELLTVKLQSEGQRHCVPHARTQRAVLTHRGLVKREVDSLMKTSDKKAMDQVLGRLDSARRVHRKDLLAIDDELVKTAVSRLGQRVFGGQSSARSRKADDTNSRPLTSRNLSDHTKAHSHPPLSARGYGSRSHTQVSDYSSIRSDASSRASFVSRASSVRSEDAHTHTHAHAHVRGNSGAMTHRAHNQSLTKAHLRQLDRALYSKISQRVSGRNICIRAFRFFDRSRRNHIEFDDFKEVCVELGMGMSDREMRQLFKCYDLNRSGAITFDEFKQTLMNMGAQPGIATWSEEISNPHRHSTQHGLGDGGGMRARDLLLQKAVQRGYDRFQLQKAFRRFVCEDTDEIDEASFAKACRAVGSNFADSDVHDLFKRLAGPNGRTVLVDDMVEEFYVPAQHK